MPKPVLPQIIFDPNGGTIKAEIKFETLLLCTYTLDLREAESNASVDGYPKQGDNTNTEDDIFSFPLPITHNKNRAVWITFVLIDQTGGGGDYKVSIDIIQGGKKIWHWESGEKTISGNFQIEASAGLLTM